MKRASIATGMAVALVLGAFGGPASAGERRRTQSAPYTGHSFESDCRPDTREEVRDFWALECRQEKAVHDAVFSERTAFAVPSWARSVRVSIRDDSGRPVAFRIYFDDDAIDKYRFTNSTCVQRATLNLRMRTKRVAVARHLGGCGATPTTGTVTATFSSRPSSNPSPRRYVAGGCILAGVSGVGFSGWSCSYTASKPGGYFAAGVWRIQIVRGERTIELETVKDPHCSPTGFIRSGDRVTIARGLSRIPWIDAGYVAAGDDVHCLAPLGRL